MIPQPSRSSRTDTLYTYTTLFRSRTHYPKKNDDEILIMEQEADLVVSDVEMPRMDGFELTETIRGSKRLRNLPVVLVTARETEEDKLRGLQAGADAYLLKSAFDQTSLIQVNGQIL